MRNVVSVSLEDAMLKNLSKIAKTEHTSRSEIIKRALNKLFYSYELSKLRDKGISQMAKKRKVLTDDDVFGAVS